MLSIQKTVYCHNSCTDRALYHHRLQTQEKKLVLGHRLITIRQHGLLVNDLQPRGN